MKHRCCLFFSLLCLMLTACRHHNKPISFYYWKTQFSLNEFENNILKQQDVTTLYVRYFDIDFAAEAAQPAPVSPIHLDTSIKHFKVVPVIFIKNRTFERLDSAAIITMAANTRQLVDQINQSQHISTSEIQFDCDWTERTRNNFFLFIRHYRTISKQVISSTIRLHQVKYKERAGIPPVDYGVLMYYNMGTISADDLNSIYEQSIANRYNSFIKSYPLQLDVALPVFSWSFTIREGKVVELLNKIDFASFNNDSNFIRAGINRFKAKHSCFKAGHYFKANDEIKQEHVPVNSLLDITDQINRYSNLRIGKLIFYDLDSSNLIQYEKDLFEKIRSNVN